MRLPVGSTTDRALDANRGRQTRRSQDKALGRSDLHLPRTWSHVEIQKMRTPHRLKCRTSSCRHRIANCHDRSSLPNATRWQPYQAHRGACLSRDTMQGWPLTNETLQCRRETRCIQLRPGPASPCDIATSQDSLVVWPAATPLLEVIAGSSVCPVSVGVVCFHQRKTARGTPATDGIEERGNGN